MTQTANFTPLGAFSSQPDYLPKIGVLGASRIVRSALCEPALGLMSVEAVAARDLGRARLFADEHEIASAFGSYQELLEDSELDAVYVALPCAFHSQWCEAALRAGKHVLCEKPFSLNLEEADRAVSLAVSQERLLMEAHHWRYHPLVSEAESALAELGPLTSIEASFKVGLNHPGDIRLDPALGPGVVMDFGCYLVQWCSWLAEKSGEGKERPAHDIVSATLVEAAPGVDVAASVEASFGGIPSRFECDMRDDLPYRSFVRAQSSRGSLHFENPLSITASWLAITLDGKTRRILPRPVSTYRAQLEAFVAALRTGESVPTAGASIMRTQASLDEIYRRAGVISRSELREASAFSGSDRPRVVR